MPRTKKELDLAAKARNRRRLAKAIFDILANEETPWELEDRITDFLCDAGNGNIVGRYTKVPRGLQALEHTLAFAEWEKANRKREEKARSRKETRKEWPELVAVE